MLEFPRKKICAWPMEFLQLGTVIYNEGKGNEQNFKEERRKNPSNNINKSYSEIPKMRCNIDLQMTCSILVSILDLWTSLPQCLRVRLFHSVSMPLLPGSIFRVCVTDTISAEYGHGCSKLLKNYATNSSKCHQNSRSEKWRPLKLETFICQIKKDI